MQRCAEEGFKEIECTGYPKLWGRADPALRLIACFLDETS
jgi:hypothetical protein